MPLHRYRSVRRTERRSVRTVIFGNGIWRDWTVALLLFAFTTLLGNLFYCEGCLNYIARRTLKNKEMNVFRLFAVVVVFIGAQLQFGLVWDLADVLMGIMAIINLPVIVILGNTALKCLDDYQAQKKEGKNPCFKAESIGLEGKTEFWN